MSELFSATERDVFIVSDVFKNSDSLCGSNSLTSSLNHSPSLDLSAPANGGSSVTSGIISELSKVHVLTTTSVATDEHTSNSLDLSFESTSSSSDSRTTIHSSTSVFINTVSSNVSLAIFVPSTEPYPATDIIPATPLPDATQLHEQTKTLRSTVVPGSTRPAASTATFDSTVILRTTISGEPTFAPEPTKLPAVTKSPYQTVLPETTVIDPTKTYPQTDYPKETVPVRSTLWPVKTHSLVATMSASPAVPVSTAELSITPATLRETVYSVGGENVEESEEGSDLVLLVITIVLMVLFSVCFAFVMYSEAQRKQLIKARRERKALGQQNKKNEKVA
jgi:hypothetical protein